MVPARVNTSGSSLARWSWKRRMRILAAAVCFLQLASPLSAAEPELVKLAVSEGKDIRFAHLTSKDGLPPGTIRNILQDDQGFLWFNTSGALNRYDGYKFKSYRRDRAHPNYPAGGFLHTFSRTVPGFCGSAPMNLSSGLIPPPKPRPASRSTATVRIVSSGQSSTSARIGPGSCGCPPRLACIVSIRRAARFATILTIRLIPAV